MMHFNFSHRRDRGLAFGPNNHHDHHQHQLAQNLSYDEFHARHLVFPPSFLERVSTTSIVAAQSWL